MESPFVGNVNTTELSVSVVTYAPDLDVLRQTIRSLHSSVVRAKSNGIISDARLFLVDHGPGSNWSERLAAVIDSEWEDNGRIISPQSNRGFGAGHNIAIAGTDGSYHLVINPDVVVYENAISEAVHYMEQHPNVGLVTPKVFGSAGEQQFLCKKYPSVLNLLLRGFAPEFIQKLCERRLADYEMRSAIRDRVVSGIQIASGCFMFLRRQALDDVSGFSPRFFLYFEDFDLCMRLRQSEWDIAYAPQIVITHFGGNAASKGLRHVIMFVSSAAKFFNQHGWKLS